MHNQLFMVITTGNCCIKLDIPPLGNDNIECIMEIMGVPWHSKLQGVRLLPVLVVTYYWYLARW